MDISQVVDFDTIMPSNVTRFLMGPAGIGKSSLVKLLAKKRGYKVVDLRLSELEPADLVGMPVITPLNDGTGRNMTTYAAPEWWIELERNGGKNILFLDELDRAREDMQPLAMQLTLDRRAGGRTLPDSVIIYAAGNGIKYQTANLDQALVNRLAMIDFTPSAAEWVAWASETDTSEVHPAVVQFISSHKELLDIPAGKHGVPNEPVTSRRSWAVLGRILQTTPSIQKNLREFAASNKLFIYAAPFIGDVPANAFASWVRDNFHPLDINDIFSGKLKSGKGFPMTQVIHSLSDVIEKLASDAVNDEQRINAGLFYESMGQETFSAFFERVPPSHGGFLRNNDKLKKATTALVKAKAALAAKANVKPAAAAETDADSSDGQ